MTFHKSHVICQKQLSLSFLMRPRKPEGKCYQNYNCYHSFDIFPWKVSINQWLTASFSRVFYKAKKKGNNWYPIPVWFGLSMFISNFILKSSRHHIQQYEPYLVSAFSEMIFLTADSFGIMFNFFNTCLQTFLWLFDIIKPFKM